VAACVEAVPIGQQQALVEHLLELPAVVDLRHRVGVRELVGADHVAAAQFGRVEVQLARGGVEQALGDVDRLRPAGAAVGAGGGAVAEHRGEVQVDERDVVDAGGDPRADQKLDRRAGGRRVGADVGERADAQRQHLAARVECHLGAADEVASVRRGEEVFHAFGLPLHRPLQLQRGIRDGDVLGVDAGLHAEAATDIADQHAHGVGAEPGNGLGETAPHTGGHLARQAHRQAAVGP
jgi:hypothetical protein